MERQVLLLLVTLYIIVCVTSFVARAADFVAGAAKIFVMLVFGILIAVSWKATDLPIFECQLSVVVVVMGKNGSHNGTRLFHWTQYFP